MFFQRLLNYEFIGDEMESSQSKASNKKSYKTRWLWRVLLICLMSSICFIAFYIIFIRMHASIGFSLKAHSMLLPADDNELEKWLKSQPGVVPWTVRVRRNHKWLHVSFILSQNLLRNPPLPNLSQACSTMGYSSKTDWIPDMTGSAANFANEPDEDLKPINRPETRN
jgi:hypothetical protein